jgi:hypothetical protein
MPSSCLFEIVDPIKVCAYSTSLIVCGPLLLENETCAGLKRHPAAAGKFVQLNVRVPVNPDPGVIKTAICPASPRPIVNAVGVVVIVKPDFTVCVTTADVEPKKLPSPEYTAVIACGPAVKVAVEYVATPETTGTVASAVVPSRNTTAPVGTPVVLEATVAVKVTFTPEPDGEPEVVTEVTLCALEIVRVPFTVVTE